MTRATDLRRAPKRYPLYVVAGRRGSGKTSFINELLTLRPPDEHWAVLVTDDGHTQLNPASADSRVSVRNATGACACCTGEVVFVTALATLIRQTRPDRVFVEASSQASLESLLRSIRSSFKGTVQIEQLVLLSSLPEPVTSVEAGSITNIAVDGWLTQSAARALLEKTGPGRPSSDPTP